MTGALSGARVLVPRADAWGDRVAAELRRRGAEPVVAPLIRTVPPREAAVRDGQFAQLAEGRYEWLFVTSAASLEQLDAFLTPRGLTMPATTQIAAVGQATARAVATLGADVAFVPVGQSSARAMVAQWSAGRSPASTGRCLVVRSDLAAAVVSDELEMQGYAVDVCIGYRTVGVDLPPEVADDLRDGRIDIVLLTSLSVARELRRQLFRGAAAPGGEKTCLGDASLPGRPGILPASVLVASIGPGTTRDAESLGFTVGHTAHTQSVDALLAELDARPRLPEEVAP